MEAWKARVYATYVETAPHETPEHRHDHLARDRAEYVRRFRRFLPRDTSAPILDVGCGTGTFLDALRSLGYSRAEGVDVSATQIDVARGRGLPRVTHGSALDYLQHRPQQYAMITALSVLEHQTRPELFDLLDAIRDALLPGGCLVAVVPNAKGLFGAHLRFADITHELSFSPLSVAQVCAVTGFEPPELAEHGGPIVHGAPSAVRWAVWQLVRLGLWVARIAESGDWRSPFFTQDLLFVARKRVESGQSANTRLPSAP